MTSSDGFLCLSDFEHYARSTLPRSSFLYFSGGADDEITLKENASAFQRYQIIPRVLRDVSKRKTGTTILGHPISFPVCISPTAFHGLAHPDGEVATVKGVMPMKIGYTQSSISTRSIDEVADAGGDCLRFFQVSLFTVRDLTLSLIRWAERRNFKALVVTVDLAALGNRSSHNRVLKQIGHITRPKFGNLGEHYPCKENNYLFDETTTWKDIKWLKSQTKLPMIIKGILNAEDAEIAVESGASGILVSNHGGRQLDSVPASIDVLADVVKAVDGRCEVYMDGGVRRGTDIFKALALGARVVFIGRPVIYALSYKGEEGVRQMLQILKDEFLSTMALTGCATVDDIKASMIVRNRFLESRL